MKLMEYWPLRQNIIDCIRTEAEELAEHTLLAVHEPVRLLRHDKDGVVVGHETEADLLRHFLNTPRPLPIIGKPGVGKSHIIRWLDANLRLMPESENWHIVRIPKSASLREVLTLLLKGLDGETFDEARSQIDQVSEKLTNHELAEWLLVIMGQQLRRLHEKNQQEMQALRQQKNLTAAEREALKPRFNELNAINIHAAEHALPTLINDVYFKQFLLNEQHCLFRLTKRLTSGATSDELGENEQQLKASDLDFELDIGALSGPAKTYINQAKLHTHEADRQAAAAILNMVLGDATRTLFNQLYSFRGRSFSDLFTLIRQALHQKGKTLMVLVEDMSLITAIEDVLIDSLEREGIRDGEEVLCPVCSAIAVTDGYAGYQRRRQGMRDRAKGEWVIEEVTSEESSSQVTQQRIIDFCSRYLNAARFGSATLGQLWQEKGAETHWPPVWDNQDSDEALPAFGGSSLGIPLFPFNANAICALANQSCRDPQGSLKFNPRQIINEILLKVLLHNRGYAEEERFPPARLAEMSASASVRAWLYQKNIEHPERAESVLAIWGYPANTYDGLKKTLHTDIVRCFGHDKLSTFFTSVAPAIHGNQGGKGPFPPPPPPPPPSPGAEDFLVEAEKAVDKWFHKGERLDQNYARLIRNSLANLYELYGREQISREYTGQCDWEGVKSLPAIRTTGNNGQVNIYLHNADTNRGEKAVWFCSEERFKHPRQSVILFQVAMALIRAEYYRAKLKRPDWSYQNATSDFLYIQNFASEWVPYAVRALIKEQRAALPTLLTTHLNLARALGLIKTSDTSKTILHALLLKSDEIRKKKPTAVVAAVDAICQKSLKEWDNARAAWLDLVAPNDHALEGDELPSALLDAYRSPVSSALPAAVKAATKELEPVIASLAGLQDCTTGKEFAELVKQFSDLFMEMNAVGDYTLPPSMPLAPDFVAELKALSGENVWAMLQNLRQVTQSSEVISQWQSLCKLDRDLISQAGVILTQWTQISSKLLILLNSYNAEMGSDRIVEVRAEIDAMLGQLNDDLRNMVTLAGRNDDNA